MAIHNDIGKYGEDLAAEWLSKQGYRILDRNWTFRRYELDIVCEKNGLVIVVEVKCRVSGVERVTELLDNKKKRCLIRGGAAWLARHRSRSEIRFDLITVTGTDFVITHYPEAISVCDSI